MSPRLTRILMVLLLVCGAVAIVCSSPVKCIAEEKKVSLAELPASVRETVQQQAAGAEITEIEMEKEDGKVVYEIEILKDGEEKDFCVAPDGRFLGFEDDEEDGDDDDDEDDDGDEMDIAFADLPEIVKASAKRLLGANQDFKASQENENGLLLYEIEIEKDGLERSIECTQDGIVVEVEQEIKVDQLPESVVSIIQKHHPNATIKEAESFEIHGYEVKLLQNGKTMEVCFPGDNEDDDDDDDD